jgi:integrase
MPLKLIAPGRRKNNRFYLVRGTVGGQRVEVSAETTDKGAAERFAADLTLRLDAEATRQRGPDAEDLTFREASQLYIAYRQPSKVDRQRIEKLNAVLGDKLVRPMVHASLVAAANELYPGMAPATKNRNAMRPAAAILHYAADNGFRDWLRVKLFKEPKATTRAAPQSTKTLLLANTAGKKRLLVLWLFEQGTRITDTLRVDWPQLDLQAGTFKLWISKTQEWRTFPLDEAVVAALANEDQDQPLWPWTSRSSVYNWLIPLVRELGVTFTPHMGRHTLGTGLNASGAGLKTIMAALGQDDPKSAARYATADVEIVRQAKRKMTRATRQRGRIGGK